MKQAEAKLGKILSATFNVNSEVKFALGWQMDPGLKNKGWQRFLNYGHLTGHFAQTVGGESGNVITL